MRSDSPAYPFYHHPFTIGKEKSLISTGGSSTVSRGTLLIHGQPVPVAMKVVINEPGKNRNIAFKCERETLQYLTERDTPGIVKYYGYTSMIDRKIAPHTLFFIFTEIAPYGALDFHVKHLSQHTSTTFQVLQGATRGLKAIHQLERLHNDVKAANLLVFEGWAVKWADFGLSSTLSAHGKIGTRSHMAPEVLTEGAISKASDIYSLGVMMLETQLSLEPKLHHREYAELIKLTTVDRRADIPVPPQPTKLNQLMRWCTMFNPLDRPSEAELMVALERPMDKLIDESTFRKTTIVNKVKFEIREIIKTFTRLNDLIRLHVPKIKNSVANTDLKMTLPPELTIDIDHIENINELANHVSQVACAFFGDCLQPILWLKLNVFKLQDLFTEEDSQDLLLLLSTIESSFVAFKKIKSLIAYLSTSAHWDSVRFLLPDAFMSELHHIDSLCQDMIKTFENKIVEPEPTFEFRA